ncbi:hypothetical protein WAI453_007410 [Rhynchosporium graminicola]
MHFTNIFTASAVFALAQAATLNKRSNLGASLLGKATFYGGNTQGGKCSFSTYTIPSNLFGTAIPGDDWDGSANCGRCVEITGPPDSAGKTSTVTAMAVDVCPECVHYHLDLFSSCFSTLAEPSKGIIPISWKYVDCPITSPITVNNKEGVSPYWFSMQVLNANTKVQSLEVSTDGGNTWKPTVRQDYNFFEISSGTGTSAVDVKVTSAGGDPIIIKNVQIAAGKATTASRNFNQASPPPPAASKSALAPVQTSTSEPAIPAPTYPAATDVSPVTTISSSETCTSTTTVHVAEATQTTSQGIPTPSSSTCSTSSLPEATSTAAQEVIVPTTTCSTPTLPEATSTAAQEVIIPTTTCSTPTLPEETSTAAQEVIIPTTTCSTSIPSSVATQVSTYNAVVTSTSLADGQATSTCSTTPLPTSLYSVVPIPSKATTAGTIVSSVVAHNTSVPRPTGPPPIPSNDATSSIQSLACMGLVTFLATFLLI